MSDRATELIEKVKALTPEERLQFAELMSELRAPEEPPAVRKVQIPDYAARLKKDFPNGIVIEDPQAFWDEVRAERIDCLR